MYKTDYHIHTNRSFDGQMNIVELCSKAIELGFLDIAVTDHCECQEENVKYDYNISLNDFITAKEKFEGKINLRFGVELGQPTQKTDWTNKFLENTNYDFIIGSLHNNNNEPDYFDLDYSKINIDEYLTRYYEEMLEMCIWGRFDVLGHLDYSARYLAREKKDFDFSKYKDVIAEIFKVQKDNGRGIEVNTSTLRADLGRTMPQFELIKLYKDLGGEIITIGSDAHKTKHIGYGYDIAREQILNAGFSHITIFDNRKPIQVKII